MKLETKKTILITGASSGIGKFLCEHYSKNYHVIGIDINSILNNYYFFYTADLFNTKKVKDIINNIENNIDIAILCAGVPGQRKRLLDYQDNELIEDYKSIFIPFYNPFNNILQKMITQKTGGKIISIASVLASIGLERCGAYSMAKSSIISLSRTAAREHYLDNIYINTISPATIDTPMIRQKYNGKLKDYNDTYFTGGCGHVEDIASVTDMLISNRFMTGQDIIVDGGLTNLFTI